MCTPRSLSHATLVPPRRNHNSSTTTEDRRTAFGGDQREALGQVETQLVPEDTAGPGTGPVRLVGAVYQHMGEQILVGGVHGRAFRCRHSRAAVSYPFASAGKPAIQRE